CGIVPKIYDLADEDMPITLTISLHAPNDEIRSTIMPVNNKYKMDELLKACEYYKDKTGRRLSFEYSLISGVNDSKKQAQELAERLRPLNAHVNLIPVNKVEEREYKKGTRDEINSFSKHLNDCGVNATIRRELGADISASCGQLRKKTANISE
ncbi:MAG: 23S rRNA (adenine(2503)-C(2))-methyltransferase RlmN, partial [Clostridia bacterium]|nr:23S rRNA (adenine(2503)-C(2))-methyltransferase RlmN [Clostridia bacterium]